MAPLPLDTAQRNRLVALLASRDALSTPLKRRNLLDEAGLEALHTTLDLNGDAKSFARQLLRRSWEEDPALYRALLTWLHGELRGHAEDTAFVAGLLAEATHPPDSPRPPAPAPQPKGNGSGGPRSPAATSSAAPADPAREARAQRRADLQMALLIVLAIVALIPLGWAIFEWWEIVEPLKEILALLIALLIALFRLLTGKLPYAWLADTLLERARAAEGCYERLPLSPNGERGPGGEGAASSAPLSLAEAERAYLARRAREESVDMAPLFEPLRGRRKLPPLAPLYKLLPYNPELRGEKRTVDAPATPFSDIAAEIEEHPRAVLVGDPGSGKTTTFLALDSTWRKQAGRDARAPLPCFVRLRNWTRTDESLDAFLDSQLPELRGVWPTLVGSERLRLLLDGLDQIPPAQRRNKVGQIKAWGSVHPNPRLYVSCRQADLDGEGIEFDLPRLEIQPLEPEQIRDYIRRYMALDAEVSPREAAERAEQLFWEVAGGEEVREVWEVWRKARATVQQFWNSPDIPRNNPPVYLKTTVRHDTIWQERVRTPTSLMALASNPYMLLMMIGIYGEDRQLPRNRGDLFRRFVTRLLEREARFSLARRDEVTHRVEILPAGHALLVALQHLAYAMQERRTLDRDGASASVVALERAEVVPRWLNEEQLATALAANLLVTSDSKLSFGHQLLQEYFAARQLLAEIEAGAFDATTIWPRERWWARTGWEVTAELLAGLQPERIEPLFRWLARANPLVAVESVLASGATLPTRALLAESLEPWAPLLTNVQRAPVPAERAAVGRALATAGLDERPGVGLRADGLPDIAWVPLEEGEFPIGGDKDAWGPIRPGHTVPVKAFSMAKYPVTNVQWEAFLTATDGYERDEWWRGLAGGKQRPEPPRWREGNHPRESVNWYEAVAFCRWLSVKLGYEVRLPTEIEWERAARGEEGRIYPWGPRYESGYANIDERMAGAGPHYLTRTSAVGIYPQGATPEGICDLAGNVWEWTSTEWNEGRGGSNNFMSTSARVLRGGSWFDVSQLARAGSRLGYLPDLRYDDWGFRLVGPAVVALDL